MDSLEFSNITSEITGSMIPGKLKMTNQSIIFKNNKTGKIEQIQGKDIEVVNFQNFVNFWGIRIFLQNGTLHRFGGFKDNDKEKIAVFFSKNYKKDMLEKQLSLKGWNWGTTKFNGSVLNFNVGYRTAFEIPLNHVSKCISGKNEIIMEFHQNDDAPVSLLEMRFFIPGKELAENIDSVETFHRQVISKANIMSLSGDAIAVFREIHCLTPRGRYDIKIFQSFFQLHGKTFDFKIPLSSVLRLFILPHMNCRQMLFVISLDPPIKQGKTRYNFLVLLFEQEEKTSIELPFSEEELKKRYEDKLTKQLSGPTYEVLGNLMKVIVNRKLIGSGEFLGHSRTPVIGCSFKAASGYLYPLENGFIYIYKPPIHIRFEEISYVNFARGCSSTKSFDLEIELKSGSIYNFNSILKEEYGKLYDFIISKKLHIKNRARNNKSNYKDDYGDSDNPVKPDAYLARVKAEAKERDTNNDDFDQNSDDSTDEDFKPIEEESDSSTDEDFKPIGKKTDDSTDKDFKPIGEKSDVAEKYDSTHSDSDDFRKVIIKPTWKLKKYNKSTTAVSQKSRKKKDNIKDNKPKRPAASFMLWLNEMREKIKADNPGIKVTEIASKGGKMWKELKDKSKWENEAAKAKIEYNNAMKEYLASTGGIDEMKKNLKKRKYCNKSAPILSKNTGIPVTKRKKESDNNSHVNNDKKDEEIAPTQEGLNKCSKLEELGSTSH